MLCPLSCSCSCDSVLLLLVFACVDVKLMGDLKVVQSVMTIECAQKVWNSAVQATAGFNGFHFIEATLAVCISHAPASLVWTGWIADCF